MIDVRMALGDAALCARLWRASPGIETAPAVGQAPLQRDERPSSLPTGFHRVNGPASPSRATM
jgi:hypothetical protein